MFIYSNKNEIVRKILKKLTEKVNESNDEDLNNRVNETINRINESEISLTSLYKLKQLEHGL